MKIGKKEEKLNYRFENFGGIIANNNPPFLAFVNRNYMRELGLGESEIWNTSDESIGLLSAPTEVHFQSPRNVPFVANTATSMLENKPRASWMSSL